MERGIAKTLSARISLAVVLVAVLGACEDRGSTIDAGTPTTPAVTAAPPTSEVPPTTEASPTTEVPVTTVPPFDLVIWADEIRANLMRDLGSTFTEATGVSVVVETVAFGDLRDRVRTSGPTAEGPDLFVGAGAWLGELVTTDAVAPIDLGARANDYVPVALEMFSAGGTLYGLPYATEAVALYYNRALVGADPIAARLDAGETVSVEEIATLCASAAGFENCLGLPGGGAVADPYHQIPFLTAQGGGIFGRDVAGGYDVSDVRLDSAETIAGVEELSALVEAGVIGSVNYERAKSLFLDGRQPFWITGPWELGVLRDSDLDWGVAPLPTIGGGTAAALVGGQGIYVSAFSERPVIAQSFLLDLVATDEAMQALFDTDQRPPAHIPTLRTNAAEAAVAVFAGSVANGLPWPAVPEIESVWDPLGENLLAVRNGELTAAEAMANAQAAVVEALALE